MRAFQIGASAWTISALVVLASPAAAQPALPEPEPTPDLPPPPPPPLPPDAAAPAPQQGSPPPPGYGQPGHVQPAYGTPGYWGYGPPPPPRVPPPVERGVHLHDGLYVRLGFGGGSLRSKIAPSDASATDVEISGTALGFDMGVGGTPIEGFVLGGRLSGISAAGPAIQIGSDEQSSNGSLNLSTIQMFTDIYPWPSEGLHIFGAFGFATLTYDPTANGAGAASSSVNGYAFGTGAGWEAWVGKQWSIGGMLALHWARFHDDIFVATRTSTGGLGVVYDGDADIHVFSPMLAFTATNH